MSCTTACEAALKEGGAQARYHNQFSNRLLNAHPGRVLPASFDPNKGGIPQSTTFANLNGKQDLPQKEDNTLP